VSKVKPKPWSIRDYERAAAAYLPAHLQKQLDQAERRADQAERRADEAEQRAARERDRAEKAENELAQLREMLAKGKSGKKNGGNHGKNK